MKKKKGFTLLELVVVIIIIAILASLGFTQYTKIVERGRASEARTILGQLRTAQEMYQLEYYTGGTYINNFSNLGVEAPSNCDPLNGQLFYFRYWCITNPPSCNARRCTSGGKSPPAPTTYDIGLYQNGTFIGGPP